MLCTEESYWFICRFMQSTARYRNQTSQAESYYRHAAQLVPSNGLCPFIQFCPHTHGLRLEIKRTKT